MSHDPYKKFAIVQATGGAFTTVQTLGCAVAASSGVSKIFDADGMWVTFQSGAVSGNYSGITPGFVAGAGAVSEGIQRQAKPVHQAVIKTPATITNVQFQIGLISRDDVNDPSVIQHEAKFFYDTNIHGSAFWRTQTDNDSGSQEVAITTQPVLASTKYYFKIDCSNTSQIKFYINNILASTHTLKLPDLTTYIDHCITVMTRTNATRQLLFGRSYLEFS